MWRTVETPVTPFTPWPNTLAYFPFRSDLLDVTGNYTLRVNGVYPPDITTNDDIPCLLFNRSSQLETTTNVPITWTDAFTVSMWVYAFSVQPNWLFTIWQPPAQQDPLTGEAIVWGNRAIWEYFRTGGNLFVWCWWNDVDTQIWIWADPVFVNYIFVQDNNHVTIYENWIRQFDRWNFDYDIQAGPLIIWWDTVSWAKYDWYMNEVILEDRAWTQSDVTTYFNNSCREYWYLPIS